jgi:hypothetical protein
MAVELNDLIHVYDDVLDSSVCNTLIQLFESNLDKHERVEQDKKPNFTQFNLTANNELSEQVKNTHNFLISKVFEYKKKYYEFVDSRCFPTFHAFEQFRIKKYLNDGNDMFDTHVDVTDYESSRRFLSFMWYLNDVEAGGETVFSDLRIQPKAGRMVVFPPLWMFPHRGEIPISNEKYILSTYLHYK